MKYQNIEQLTIENENNIVCKRHKFTQKNIHWHSYYELELVAEGKGTHTINGTPYPYRKGDVFLLLPSDFHEFHLEEEGTNFLIEIPASLFPENAFDVLFHLSDNLITHFEDEEFEMMKNLFFLIEKHYQKKGLINAEVTKTLLSSLLLLFAESFSGIANTNPKKSNDRLRDVILYIQQNFRRDITLKSIASRFYINKEYLSELFKAETGTTLTSYIRKLRLGYGAKLAVTTNMKSIDISESCGFNSVPSFLRNFKAEYGVSPMEMRKNNSLKDQH